MSKINTAPGGVVYRVDLGNKPYMEFVECMWSPNTKSGHFCTLYRFNKIVTNFMATASQARKIQKQRGKLNITNKMIQKAKDRYGGAAYGFR